MEYNIYFCGTSILYLGLTSFFYLRSRRVRSLISRVYSHMLLVGFCSLFFDIFSALMDENGAGFPLWSIYAVNVSLYISATFCSVGFMMYTLVLTNRWQRLKIWQRWVVFGPYALLVLSTLLSCFTTWGIFYIDADHVFHPGATHFLIYAITALYVLNSVAVIYRARYLVNQKKQIVVYSFVLICAAAMFVQMFNPHILLNSTATALALTLVYFSLESPANHIDSLTDTFNREAMQVIVKEYYEKHKDFNLLLFPLKNFKLINYTLGFNAGDVILTYVAEYLQRTFKSAQVMRIHGDVFAVIPTGNGELSIDYINQLHRQIPTVWPAGGLNVPLSIGVMGIRSRDCVDLSEMLAAIEVILNEHSRGDADVTMLADAAFLKRCTDHAQVEAALQNALEDNSLQVYYQPIHTVSGRLIGFEALSRIYDEELGFLPTEEFVRIAEQNGLIFQLGEQVLRKVCGFLTMNDTVRCGIEHVSVNLSVVECMQEDMAERIHETVQSFGLDPSLLGFELTETEAVTSMPAVQRNMRRLAELGYAIFLDDFGSGYANFEYLTLLPLHYVKIDKGLLWNAMNDAKQRALLAGVTDVLKRLDLVAIAEGAETPEQIELLKNTGIGYVQGFFYSEAICGDFLEEYVLTQSRKE